MRSGLNENAEVYVEKPDVENCNAEDRDSHPFGIPRRTPELRLESLADPERESLAKAARRPPGTSAPAAGAGRIGGRETGRRRAGVPGLSILDFQGFELISGDFKRFKGVSPDLKSKPFERGRVNHLCPGFAINRGTKRGIRVTQNLNTPNRPSDAF